MGKNKKIIKDFRDLEPLLSDLYDESENKEDSQENDQEVISSSGYDEEYAQNEFDSNIENYPEFIGFLGREEEFTKLQAFLSSPSKYILELCGVPMIGKTALTREFCERNNISHKRIIFRQKPYTPAQDIQEQLFGNQKWNDFSEIDADTVLIIENFEQALEWTPKSNHLHEIKADKVHDFLNGVLGFGCKLIIESRFQTRFDSMQRFLVQSININAIPTTLFWKYYSAKKFTEQDFETLCERFNEHTGLLAIAYNDAEWLYENELKKAIHEPNATSQNLWKILEVIIKKLQKAEKQLLAALTLWQKPITKKELSNHLQGYVKGNIDECLMSLRKKLLVTSSQKAEYTLNPYLAEVCYTFFEGSAEITELKKLAAFKTIANPEYNRIKQASDKGDYTTFYKLVKELRKNNKFDAAHQILNYALEYDYVINKSGVLNEIAVTYKGQKNYTEAKRILEKAFSINPNDVKTLNELGIIYKEEGNYTEAKKVLEKALQIEPQNVKVLNELGIIHKEEGSYLEAKKILEKACKQGNIHSYNELALVCKEEGNYAEAKRRFLELIEKHKHSPAYNGLAKIYKEEGNYTEAKKILEKGLKIYPNEPYLKNSLKSLPKQMNMNTNKEDSKAETLAKGKILFLAANPKDATRLQVDKEHRIIKEKLRKNDYFELLQPELSLTIENLIQAMNQKAQIVHFAGHGEEEGIIITTADNNAILMPVTALKRLFKQHKESITLVVLNSCYSEEQAKVISEFGMYVIGMKFKINDDAAIDFAAGLYIGLAEGKNVEDAYNDAMIVIETKHPGSAHLPQVWKDGEHLDW